MATVLVKRLDPFAKIPEYAKPGDAGMDLCSIVYHTIAPRTIVKIPTGLSLAIPMGYEGQVRSRSGLSSKCGICVVNSPGTIDSGYRGEVMVALINHGTEEFEVKPGDRIAQLVIAPVETAVIVEVNDLSVTERGAGGFGCTGIK